MDTRKALDSQAIFLMIVLCATWGMQQVVLKATASEIPPILQIALRSGGARIEHRGGQAFDEQLRHYADLRIKLDLDDGVKVNYGKFSDPEYGDILAEVKAICGTKDED